MAKAPPPKNNFAQTMLIMVICFMAYQMFTMKKEPEGPVITADQHFATMQKMNAQRLDVSIARENNAYSNALDDLVKQKKLSEKDAEWKKVQGDIMVADTQLVAGLHAQDSGRLRDAYNTLQPLQKQYLDKPIWNQSVKVATPPKDLKFGAGWGDWTGQALYQQVVDSLTTANRHELVYGFIPGFQFMDVLVRMTGAVSWYSYALAGFLLALLVRAIVFPLSQKQLMFSRQMGQLGPLVKEIKDQFKDDAQETQKRTMKLYQEYGLNPLQGCFPALIQAPLFITVYQCMLRYQFEFQKGTFLWINKSTSLATHGFVAPNLGQTDYILIVIYGITMLSSTLLTPASDPSQVKQQRIMSVGISLMFTFFMMTGKFPVVSGFVLYWVFTNILSTAQSIRAYRMPLPPLVKVNASGGGVYPKQNKFQQWIENAQKMQEQQQNHNPGANSASSKWNQPATPELPPAPKPKKRTKSTDSDEDPPASTPSKPKKSKPA